MARLCGQLSVVQFGRRKTSINSDWFFADVPRRPTWSATLGTGALVTNLQNKSQSNCQWQSAPLVYKIVLVFHILRGAHLRSKARPFNLINRSRGARHFSHKSRLATRVVECDASISGQMSCSNLCSGRSEVFWIPGQILCRSSPGA